jgi:hypothetical protein
MRLKLNENLDARLTPLLAEDGHEVDTVRDESLSGSDDDTIYATCQTTRRILITFDRDFANPFRFPPENTDGIIVDRPPRPVLPAIRATFSKRTASAPHASASGRALDCRARSNRRSV